MCRKALGLKILRSNAFPPFSTELENFPVELPLKSRMAIEILPFVVSGSFHSEGRYNCLKEFDWQSWSDKFELSPIDSKQTDSSTSWDTFRLFVPSGTVRHRFKSTSSEIFRRGVWLSSENKFLEIRCYILNTCYTDLHLVYDRSLWWLLEYIRLRFSGLRLRTRLNSPLRHNTLSGLISETLPILFYIRLKASLEPPPLVAPLPIQTSTAVRRPNRRC